MSETSLQQRPVSRSLSERTQHFEEISLDSPDMGGDAGEGVEGNNNVIKMRTMGKEEVPSEKPPEEAEDKIPPPVAYYKLFRFASAKELGMVFVGVLSAIIGGCSMPFMVIMYGELANAFVEQVCSW